MRASGSAATDATVSGGILWDSSNLYTEFLLKRLEVHFKSSFGYPQGGEAGRHSITAGLVGVKSKAEAQAWLVACDGQTDQRAPKTG